MNKKVNDSTCVIALGITGAIIGAITGFGLSFTALSPLVMGGIIAAVPITLLFACDMLEKGRPSKKNFFPLVCMYATSVATGVGLAAAATAIFPGATPGTALVGAIIGATALIVGFFLTDKVDKYIISPVVECFSSKGEEKEQVI